MQNVHAVHLYVGVTVRVSCLLQLLAEVKTTLRHQVTVEYNATATYSSETRTRTHRLTVAWDALQSLVPTQISAVTNQLTKRPLGLCC